MGFASIQVMPRFICTMACCWYWDIAYRGIRELEPLQSERDIVLGTILAWMFAHRHCTVLDREAHAQLDS